jgi:hypothetical protein
MTLNKFEVVSKRILVKVVRGIFSIVRFLSDSATATDQISKEVGKPFNDSATATDVFSRIVAYLRSFADTATASDTVAKEAGKGITDVATATDLAIKSAGKGLSDSATGADAGTLLNQDYVNDPFYFADDYVGTKRTF